MTGYDGAMAIVVILGMIRGAWRGFTWQVASIASLILGYTAAHTGSAQIASHLPGDPEVQRVLAMALIYIAVSGGIFGLAWMIRGTIRKLKIETYDRHLGMLLGGIEGVGVGMLATLFLVSLAPTLRQPIFSSPTGQVVGTVMRNLGPVLPAEVRHVLAPHWDGNGSPASALAALEPVLEPSEKGDRSHATSVEPTLALLPPVEEAPRTGGSQAAASQISTLPPLEVPPGNDPAVQPVSSNPSLAADVHEVGGLVQKAPAQLKKRLKQTERRIGQAVEGALSSEKDQIDAAIDDAIDAQVHPSGNLEPAPEKGPQ